MGLSVTMAVVVPDSSGGEHSKIVAMSASMTKRRLQVPLLFPVLYGANTRVQTDIV